MVRVPIMSLVTRVMAFGCFGAFVLATSSAHAADVQSSDRGPTRPASAADAPAALTSDENAPLTMRPRALTPTSPRAVTQANTRPTLSWLLAQLIPSPGMWIGPAHSVEVDRVRDIVPGQPLPPDVKPGQRFFDHRGGVPRLTLAWQVTPLLYSWGVNRRVSPWRFLVVDPVARNSGSIELHFSPEWMPTAPETHLFYRTGFRTTLPLHQHGEYVALMLGASYSRLEGKGGVVYEGGLSLLFGTVSLVLSHSPSFPDLRYGVRLNLRYF